MSSNTQEQYPVSTKVRQALAAATAVSLEGRQPFEGMLEALESYEHGNTNLEDLSAGWPSNVGVTIEGYGAVVEDLALALLTQIDFDHPFTTPADAINFLVESYGISTPEARETARLKMIRALEEAAGV